MELVLVHEPLDRDAGLIESGLRRVPIAAVNPPAIYSYRQLGGQEAHKGPCERVVEHIDPAVTVDGVLQARLLNQKLVGDGWIIERHSSRKEAIAGDAMGTRRITPPASQTPP
jgi:hypothetical protein